MTRLLHREMQPKNIHFWDYLILCRMRPEAALVLQRLEYWDSTKDNDTGESAPGGERWMYKSAEELHWELMGLVGEKQVQRALTFLVDDLHYLAQRKNPYHGFDRTWQYAVQVSRLQQHLDHLADILGAFGLPLSRLKPVFYAIECLTREGVTIEKLTGEQVIARLEAFKLNDRLPFFLKVALKKFWQATVWPDERSSSIYALSSAHSGFIERASISDGAGNPADSIACDGVSNTREDNRNNHTENTENREFPAAVKATSSIRAEMAEKRKHLERTLGTIEQHMRELPAQEEAFVEMAKVPHTAPLLDARHARARQSQSDRPAARQQEKSADTGRTASAKRAIDAETQAVIDAWNSLHPKPAPLTEDFVRAARLLAPCRLSREDLRSIEHFCYQSNPEWFGPRGVRLDNIVTHLEKWQSWQARQRTSGEAPTARRDPSTGTVSGKKRLDLPALQKGEHDDCSTKTFTTEH